MSDSSITSMLRQRRADAGLSQAELAGRAGVSRQALIAIEAGRQVPSTTLALELARALRCRVEDLFALPQRPAFRATLAAAGSATVRRVAIGQVDGEWAAHPVSDPGTTGDGVLVGEPREGGADIEPLTDLAELERNVLVAGCAPLLGMLAGRLGLRHSDARATWISANSARALELLNQRLVHMAGVHLVDTEVVGGHESIIRERFPGDAITIVNLTRWRQGLLVAPGNPLGIHVVDDLLREDVRVARREDGAVAQKLLERLLGAVPASAVPVATSHADVARLVRWGVADVGVAIEAVALAEGLDFIPLSEERFDLIVPTARLASTHVARLIDLMDQSAFRAEASRLPGYDVSMAGHATEVQP